MIAREYLRVSEDRSGRLRSPEEQHDDAVSLCDAEGWTLGDPYAENGAVSASRYATKARAGFNHLMSDLQGDRFGADVLILWEPSRGSRRLSEWARFLELLEERGVKLHVTSHSRTYDLANARDVRSLHEDGTDSQYESAKISARVRRSVRSNAAKGRPHGRVPYGYRKQWDEATGRFVRVIVEDEARVVRELYERLRAGHSLRAIALDLEARGIRTPSGKVFDAHHLRSKALTPAYAGYRIHDPTRTGVRREQSMAPLDEATLHEGDWQAIVDRGTWYQVRAILNAPERKTTQSGRAKHLLSMIVRCGRCGGPMTAMVTGGRLAYRCRPRGCVSVAKDALDAHVEEVMLGYLQRDDVYEELAKGDEANAAELATVRGELGEYRSRLEALADNVDIDEATLARRATALKAKIIPLEGRERELQVPPRLRGLITPGKDVRRRWRSAPITARREIARMLLSPGVLGELVIVRDPRPGPFRTPVAERVEWRRG